MLNYRKASFWIFAAAIVIVLVLVVGFAATRTAREASDALDVTVNDQGDYEKTVVAWTNAWIEAYKSMPDSMAHLEDGAIDSFKLLMAAKEELPKAIIFSAEISVKPKYPIERNSFWMAGNTGSSPGRDETWGQFYREFELRQESDGKFHLVNSGTGGLWGPARYDEYDLLEDGGTGVDAQGKKQ